jgi:cell division protease FtsH
MLKNKNPMRRLLMDLESDRQSMSDENKSLQTNEDGVPQPETLAEAVQAIKEFVNLETPIYRLIKRLEKLLPPEAPKVKPMTEEEFVAKFLTGERFGETFTTAIGVSPINIALIALNDLFNDTSRFSIVDPSSLEFIKEMKAPYEIPKPTYTLIEIGGKSQSVPISQELFLHDKKTDVKYVLQYKPQMGGALAVTIEASDEKEEQATELANEIKIAVLSSPLIRGQIIEITGGSDFRVADIGEQPHPVIDERLKIELEKNIVNVFDKRAEFEKYGLPLKRSVILAGPPGCGKTMLERWLASKLRGKVTTIWVTAKSIEHPTEVAAVFDLARKLTPALVIMEDLDLIAGTRASHYAGNCLGEMLNQLDGLKSNDALVLLASTNSVSSLDSALSERPGRIDRIFSVDRPQSAVAQDIAREFMRKCKVSEEVISSLTLETFFKDGQFTGAQVVEIIKGAIAESIHRNGDLNNLCIKASKEGLEKQRDLFKKN